MNNKSPKPNNNNNFRVERIVAGPIDNPSIAEIIAETDNAKKAFEYAQNDKSGENIRISKNNKTIGVLIKQIKEFFEY